MKLLMYGVSKDTVMKEDVDKYLLDDANKKRQMNDIAKFEGVSEVIILADDFRNEYYLYVNEEIFSHGEFLRYIARKTEKTLQEVILETYSKFNEDVLRHLFEFAAGYLSKPSGSFQELWVVQQTIILANTHHTSGPVITKLLNQAVIIGYAFKLSDEMKPLNQSPISQYIYLLKEYLSDLSKKNYLISGDDFQVYFLAKVLLFAGAQTITMIQPDEKKSVLQYQRLEGMFEESEQARLFPMTEKSLYYRLSKTDAAILDSTRLNIFEQRIREEVSVIRQTKKVQYLVDTADEEQEDISFPELDFQHIDGTQQQSFNKEEQENAVAVFEEELSHRVEVFMHFLENLQANETKEMTY